LPEDGRLAAYVIPAPAQVPPTSRSLRDFLKGRLPDSSIPSAFVLLDAFPLTPSGKIDRKALPAPDPTRGGRLREFVAARPALEGQLTAIWEGLTEYRPIGVADDFFEIGGNSLVAARMFAAIRKDLGQSLPFESIL